MDHIRLTIFQVLSIGLFGFLFGLFETFTNLTYILKQDLRFARLQHGKELPKEASDHMVYKKMVQMMILGILLLCLSFTSILFAPQFFTVAGVLIFLSGLLDYSKYRKNEFFVIWIVIAVMCIISGMV